MNATPAVIRRAVIDAETGEVVPIADPNLGMEVDQARRAVEHYRDLTAAILDFEDYQSAGGDKRFVKRSGWQKIGRAYSISTEIRSREVSRDEDGKIVRADAVARAIAPDGRHADGDGACAITEDRFTSRKGRAKADHDIPATAVTRAKNRAIADLVGFGQVSAEEVDAGASEPAELPHWARNAGPDQVMALADQLVLVLTAIGDPNPADTVRVMGAVIREHAGGVPNVIGLFAALLADEAARQMAARDKDLTGEALHGAPAGDSGADQYNQASGASGTAEGPETSSSGEEEA